MYSGKLVTLRAMERGDLAKSRRWVNDAQITPLIGRALPVSDLEHERWFARIMENEKTVMFAVETKKGKRHIGIIWLWNIDYRNRKAEARIIIGNKRYWGKGYGQEALGLLVNFAFQSLNLKKVYAHVLKDNLRAVKAFEKLGFFREGDLKGEFFINGGYRDACRMGLINNSVQ